jgi:hypothetical protein
MKKISFIQVKIIISLFFCSPFINAAEKSSESEAVAALLSLIEPRVDQSVPPAQSAPHISTNYLYSCTACPKERFSNPSAFNGHFYHKHKNKNKDLHAKLAAHCLTCDETYLCNPHAPHSCTTKDDEVSDSHLEIGTNYLYSCTVCPKERFYSPSAFNGHFYHMHKRKDKDLHAKLVARCLACDETYLYNPQAPHCCTIKDDEVEKTRSDSHLKKRARAS